MGDDITHNSTLTFFFASGIQTRKTFFSSSSDGMIKWFDQFILCQKYFVNRKKRVYRSGSDGNGLTVPKVFPSSLATASHEISTGFPDL